ncbi:MAG: hypothetical protein V1647_05385, partial [Pseudomonadota bacterium]
MIEILMPTIISDKRLDGILKILHLIKNHTPLRINWSRTTKISPAGYAILSCLFDSIIENHGYVENKKIKKDIKHLPV